MSRIDKIIREASKVMAEAARTFNIRNTYNGGPGEFVKLTGPNQYKDTGMGSLQDLQKLGMPNGAFFTPDGPMDGIKNAGNQDRVDKTGKKKVVWGITGRGGKDELVIMDIDTFNINGQGPYVYLDDIPDSM